MTKKKFSMVVVFFVAGIILAAVISFNAVREAYRNKGIENEVQKLRDEAIKIQNENDNIRKRIEYYSTPEFTERVSKDKMNMQKPDENVIVVEQIPEKKVSDTNIQSETEETLENKPNHIKWWDLFFKYN